MHVYTREKGTKNTIGAKRIVCIRCLKRVE